MFNDALEQARNKPHKERQAIALGVAGIITGIIFIVWAVSFFASIQGKQAKVSTEETFKFDTLVNSLQEASNKIEKEAESTLEQFEYINDQFLKAKNETDTIIAEDIVEEQKKESEITLSGIEIIQVEE